MATAADFTIVRPVSSFPAIMTFGSDRSSAPIFLAARNSLPVRGRWAN